MDSYYDKKPCCDSCAEGGTCESNWKHKNSKGLKDNILLKAMHEPKRHSHVQFPSTFKIPKALSINKFNTLGVTTNRNGVAWVQINAGQLQFGQNSGFGNYISSNPVDGYLPRANVFYSNPANTTYDGISAALPNNQSYQNIIGSSIGGLTADYINGYRPGPAKFKFTYTGNISQASGRIFIGVSYSFVSDIGPSGTSTTFNQNGLLPDLTYSVTKAIEDCSQSLVDTATGSYEVFYVPHDYLSLDFVPQNTGITGLVQRVTFLIVGAPANVDIGVIEYCANFEAIPNSGLSDITSYNSLTYATNEQFKEAVEDIKEKGQIRRQVNMYGLEGIVKGR